MKITFLIPVFFLCVTAYANSEQVNEKFIATLPNGIKVELIGVAYHNIEDGPKLWWRPDGQVLTDEPYRRPNMYSTGSAEYSIREIVVCIAGTEDYSSTAFSSLGRSHTRPGIPKDVNNVPLSELRSFTCKFDHGQKEDTIRFGISTEPWQKVEDWQESWPKLEPEDIVIDSDNPLIFTWPRKEKRGAIIVEITHRYVNEATQLLMFDIDGDMHEEIDLSPSKGDGLAKHRYWFWGTAIEDIKRFEFQKRPYQWIEFHNVSLKPDHKTNVEIEVLSAKDKLSRGFAVGKQEKESLGYILDRLAKNLRFPENGRAKYQLEENNTNFGPNLRVLNCEYVFDGFFYKFSITGADPEDFNNKWYFDGGRTIDWPIRNKTATIRDNIRWGTPIYSIQWAMPENLIEVLSTHEVELMGSYEINGVPCFLLNSVISSKDKLKVWVAKEPDIYPVRIENLEYDNLLYVYEFENIKYWNGVLLPEKIKRSSYRSDESVQNIPLSSYIVTIESFTPNIELSESEFLPDFPSDVGVGNYPSKEPQASDLEPTIPSKYLRHFGNIDIDFNMEQAKDKMILVCFFDFEQRPSRNCIVQLAKQAKTLEQKGVIIVAVHASKADENRVSKWVKENNIPFPVGMIEGEEEVRFTWGVKSLPWLILTDREHVVIAEGFGLDELDDKI